MKNQIHPTLSLTTLDATSLELRNLEHATLADPTSALPDASAAAPPLDLTERIPLHCRYKNESTTMMPAVNPFDHDKNRESLNHDPTPHIGLRNQGSPSTAPPNFHDGTAERPGSKHGPDNATDKTPVAPPLGPLCPDENHEAKEVVAELEGVESYPAPEPRYKDEPAPSYAPETW
jgi:hypothetical protein